MKLIVDLPDEEDGRDMTLVYARRLPDDANIQVQGYRARVVGVIEERFEGLVPYLTGRAG